jgi:hypothetical protein
MTLDDDGTNANTIAVWHSDEDGKWHAAIGTAAGPGLARTGITPARAILRLGWAISETSYKLDPNWRPQFERSDDGTIDDVDEA